MAMLPLFPTDDGWPYPDGNELAGSTDDVDFDALDLHGVHTFDTLSVPERSLIERRFGLHRPQVSMKELAIEMKCSQRTVRHMLGAALEKLRLQLTA